MALNPPQQDWSGRRVWLLGASSGIGRATAEALHAAVRAAGAAAGTFTQWPHYWAYEYCTLGAASPSNER